MKRYSWLTKKPKPPITEYNCSHCRYLERRMDWDINLRLCVPLFYSCDRCGRGFKIITIGKDIFVVPIQGKEMMKWKRRYETP